MNFVFWALSKQDLTRNPSFTYHSLWSILQTWKESFYVMNEGFLVHKTYFHNNLTKVKSLLYMVNRDVTTGATGATAVAPKFSDTLTLSQPRGADSAHYCRGRS